MEKEEITKTRKTVPEWKRAVDRTLWTYRKADYALTYQETVIDELEILYASEKIGKSEADKAELEKIRIELERAKAIHRILLRRKENVGQILDWVFPKETEKRKFIEAYWLTYAGSEVQIRASLVLEILPFLGESTGKGTMRGNRNFYYWRNKIYYELAESLGYLPDGTI